MIISCNPIKGIERLSLSILAEDLDNGTDVLRRALTYCIDGVRYEASKGFITDYSSVPYFARPIVRFDRTRSAGIIHDKLYQTGKNNGEKISRWASDMAWRRIAQYGTNHANFAQAWSLWLGLRIGGWVTWRKYRKADD